ncbi:MULTISPECIES: DinB family protein [Allobacillus]|uniref:DinB family protein n=1 Tax=Allobacillus salarius TaxID=1955272 RepID=A0A556PDL8_9BACI|nr:DinB family protein [Allobacillus salarius]TSJ62463.1 DinB family protein [Allobacillus salarius]
MNQAAVLRNVMFEEIELCVRTTQSLLLQIKDTDWAFRPAENMRTLRELAIHLVSIPETDLYILKEEPLEKVQELENKYSQLHTATDMGVVFEEGYHALCEYMSSLSEEEFFNKKTKAFYMEDGHTQAQWLAEIQSHVFHHRGQFYNYLKQLQYDVTMADLYT